MYSILSDIIYSFSYFNIRKLKSIYVYLSIHIFSEGGTLGPWECGFSLHSRTTDTAHVLCFSHWFATVDNFCSSCLVFQQWLNKTENQKQKKTRNQKTRNQKTNDKTQLFATTPPLEGAVLFFGGVSCFFWFLIF